MELTWDFPARGGKRDGTNSLLQGRYLVVLKWVRISLCQPNQLTTLIYGVPLHNSFWLCCLISTSADTLKSLKALMFLSIWRWRLDGRHRWASSPRKGQNVTQESKQCCNLCQPIEQHDPRQHLLWHPPSSVPPLWWLKGPLFPAPFSPSLPAAASVFGFTKHYHSWQYLKTLLCPSSSQPRHLGILTGTSNEIRVVWVNQSPHLMWCCATQRWAELGIACSAESSVSWILAQKHPCNR